MPKYVPYKNKEGKIISYQIQVSRGYDLSGKKIRPYSMSWKIPETFKSKKAIEKELHRIGHEFEINCKRGELTSDKRTFKEYAEYYMELSMRDNKIRTAYRYSRDLQRLYEYIGDIRITDLKASDLNKMYLKLQKEGVRQDLKAIAINPEVLSELQKNKSVLNKDLCSAIGISDNTWRNAKNGKNISVETAEKIANFFDVKLTKLFKIFTLGDDQKGLSAKTVKNYHDMLHVILAYAVEEHVVKENICDIAKPPIVVNKDAAFLK